MSTLAIAVVATVLLAIVILRRSSDETITMPTDVPTHEASPSVEALVRDGRKIEAIKLVRAKQGIGLKEAKEQVDELFRRVSLH